MLPPDPTTLAGIHEIVRHLFANLILHSEETAIHSSRITPLSVRLARAMGLSEGEIVTVRYGALLHDIGKLDVPLEVLHKPGRLEPQEVRAVNMHPRNGMEIARLRRLPESICDAILYHHERYDGQGYPVGLKGEDIPLAARVIAVVDTWDTIVNKRCYRPAQAVQVAREEIRVFAGTQFDPAVAEKFLGMMAEIEEFERVRSGGSGQRGGDRQAAA